MTEKKSVYPETCFYEKRFANLESDIAELKARMDSKKDDIYNLNKELLRDHQQQEELIEKVTRVTVLLEEGQKQRDNSNRKLDESERKIDKLQTDMTSLSSSLNSFKNTIIVMIPVISIIVTVILHFLNF
jgi:DNA repair exonuclease SbcCD ATPase subunit